MAEGYSQHLEVISKFINAEENKEDLTVADYCTISVLLAIAERLERLADKPLKPVLANLAQLVMLEHGRGFISDNARERLLKAIRHGETEGGEHP